jgi:hypothetical protein
MPVCWTWHRMLTRQCAYFARVSDSVGFGSTEEVTAGGPDN